jgi:hypothetical protein
MKALTLLETPTNLDKQRLDIKIQKKETWEEEQC